MAFGQPDDLQHLRLVIIPLKSHLARIIEYFLERRDDPIYICPLLQKSELLAECQFANNIECVCSRLAFLNPLLKVSRAPRTVLQPRCNATHSILNHKLIQSFK